MMLETRPLGRSSLSATVFGLGCATLGGNMEAVSEAEAKAIVATAFEEGIRYFDTAPFYGYGGSEHSVGDGLRRRNDWVLSTKVGRLLRPNRKPRDPADGWKNPFPFEPVFDYSYDGVMRSYEDSLQRLGLNRVDILYIHDVDVFTHGKDAQPGMFRQAMEGAYKALDELRRNGEIKAIGLGVNEAKPIADALQRGQWDCFLLAGRYTLLEQEPLHTLFPAVKKHGATIVVGGPFNSGVLAGRDTWNYVKAPEQVMTRVKALARVCDAHQVPLPAAALRFVLAHPLVSSVIPGPRSAAELKQIIAWWNHKIPPALWQDLKREKLIDAESPVPG
jgi:D-threo-aldose 1-dehydrogenase